MLYSYYPLALGWMAYKLQADPDDKSTSWNYTPVKGFAKTAAAGDSTAYGNIKSQNGNYLGDLGGVDCAGEGVTVSGKPIYSLVAKAWAKARITEALQQHLLDKSANNEKIPNTDKGRSQFVNKGESIIKQGEAAEHFEEGSSQVWVKKIKTAPDEKKQDLVTRIQVHFCTLHA